MNPKTKKCAQICAANILGITPNSLHLSVDERFPTPLIGVTWPDAVGCSPEQKAAVEAGIQRILPPEYAGHVVTVV